MDNEPLHKKLKGLTFGFREQNYEEYQRLQKDQLLNKKCKTLKHFEERFKCKSTLVFDMYYNGKIVKMLCLYFIYEPALFELFNNSQRTIVFFIMMRHSFIHILFAYSVKIQRKNI